MSLILLPEPILLPRISAIRFMTLANSPDLSLETLTDGISPEVMESLIRYDWPGNIRELEHAIERALLLGKGNLIDTTDFPPPVLAGFRSEVSLAKALSKHYTLKELELEYVKKVLESTKGNKTEAAQILGVDRTTLYRKLEEAK